MINSGIIILHKVFAIVNRTRLSAAAMIVTGVSSLLMTWLMIVFTDWDIYAVAGVSSIVTICKNVFFVTPITAVLLGYRWHQFYPQLGITVICSAMIIMVGLIVRHYVAIHSWLVFFIACGIVGIVGLTLNVVIVLNKEERAYFIDKLLQKLKR